MSTPLSTPISLQLCLVRGPFARKPQRPLRPVTLLLAAIALALPSLASAQLSYIGPSVGDFNQPANYSPANVPSLATPVLIANRNDLFGPVSIQANSPAAALSFTSSYSSGPVQLAGTSSFNISQITIDLPTASPLTTASQAPWTVAIDILAPITASGLTLSSPVNSAYAFRLNSAASTFTSLTLDRAALIVGQSSQLGSPSASILMRDSTFIATSPMTFSRPIVLQSSARFVAPQGMTIDGTLSQSGVASIVFDAPAQTITLASLSSISGSVLTTRSSTLSLTGSLNQAASFDVGGTLSLGSSVANSIDRIGNSSTINLPGGNLSLISGAANYAETIGTINARGTARIDLAPSPSAGVQLVAAAINASEGLAGIYVTAPALGTAPLAAGNSIITAAVNTFGGNASRLTNRAVATHLITADSASDTSTFGLATQGANGLRSLTTSEYRTTLTGSLADDNVRLSNGAFAQNSNITVNAMVLRATPAGDGLPVSLSGPGRITLDSGVLVVASDDAGTTFTIGNDLAARANAPILVHTAPAGPLSENRWTQLTLGGAFQNNLVKTGGGTLFLSSAANAGSLTIAGGIVAFEGDVASSGNSAIGNAAVRITTGGSGSFFTGLLASTPGATVGRAISFDGSADSQLVIGSFAGGDVTFAGPISIDATRVSVLGDSASVIRFTGLISGTGGLGEAQIASPLSQTIRLDSINTFTGGVEVTDALWQIGSNNAFGNSPASGPIVIQPGNGSLQAVDGPRTLANRTDVYSTVRLVGTQNLTVTGDVFLASAAREFNVLDTNSSLALQGIISAGGLSKTGAGSLRVSGANTFAGPVTISAGTVVASSSSALGANSASSSTATTVQPAAALELSGTFTSGESIILAGGTLRSTAGNITLSRGLQLSANSTVQTASPLFLQIGVRREASSAGAFNLTKIGPSSFNAQSFRDINTLRLEDGITGASFSGGAGANSGASKVGTIVFAGVSPAGRFDLRDNVLIVGPTTLSTASVWVTGSASSALLFSGTAQANMTIGFAQALDVFSTLPSTWFGQTIDATNLLFRTTLLGDTNLDGRVDFVDLVNLARAFNRPGSWVNGDSDRNGVVDFIDLVNIARNFNQSLPGLLPIADGGGATFDAEWARAQSVVPEPALLGVMLIAGLSTLRRRRTR